MSFLPQCQGFGNSLRYKVFSLGKRFSLEFFLHEVEFFLCQSQICVSCQMVRGAHLSIIFSLQIVILSDCCLGGEGEVVGQVRAFGSNSPQHCWVEEIASTGSYEGRPL